MAIYLNPGEKRFLEAVHSDIYVDKTEMILYLNHIAQTEQKYVCVQTASFREFSIIAPMQFAEYTGFTEDEVKKLCEQHGREYDRFKE